MKKISIITVSFNSAATIEDTIKSVLSQSYPNIEYLIIDGGSTDNTMEIVNRYSPDISQVISESDRGIYDAMNKGVDRANGDIIGILNSDDFYADPNVITDVVKKLKDECTDALYADLVYVDKENTEKIVRTWKAGNFTSNSFIKGWMPPHPTFFLTKDAYNQYGFYNLELKSAADYELMLRMIHKNRLSISYLPRIITKMRTGGQSNLSLVNRIKANKEDKRAWEINGLKPNKLTLLRKPLSKLGQFFNKG